jgi:5-(carboxyamino)imidazole ribonucleotide mutase
MAINSKMIVPVLLGSDKDMDWAKKITNELDRWEIPYKVFVVSAHKVPELLLEVVDEYNHFPGQVCYLTIAGRSNGLSGVTAGSSYHPVIACPPFVDKTDMLLNINSTLQMPSDTPVLTVLDPVNAALCIVRIFALKNPELRKKYEEHLKKVKASFKV